ncbi:MULTISPECIES: PTS sugar transporter subunit IIA [Staphylococcus]|uniref:PTS system glucose-specific EIIA component n=1 Tax=Staphylococcus schleiferi TaxID=1295 RepID=A0A7Z7QPM7_STASC|nr:MULTISPECIES: PTS glucose transporter subunit IIA [Staphylococcus]QGS45387.1 PTS glucose transporter subunit IIA [Mammaliicoccus fleurettii]EPD51692.1 glucose-specific phosphotransferase enzyme IIA component [Staphylococcus sp. HGB0015]MBF1992184.1 PTS glucose transporter subunit IIA [Staphylococcus schleiferi]MBF2037878.1 PTS glucose transporter subunit IIA [Staphylococcus schleiferi]MBF2100118.1 PTS glucose transporter subunit IIA [Staphylococcus schleiferi]
MFKKLFGKNNEASKDITVYAPISGELVKIEDIPDPVFAQKMMGEGFGVQPIEGTVVSPIDGVVDNVFPTKHAISLKADNGLEVLVHIGLDTVQLNGEGFEVSVESGDRVKMGAVLVSFDLEFIKQNAKSTVSPIIITNTASTESIQFEEASHLSKGETSVIEVKMK